MEDAAQRYQSEARLRMTVFRAVAYDENAELLANRKR